MIDNAESKLLLNSNSERNITSLSKENNELENKNNNGKSRNI